MTRQSEAYVGAGRAVFGDVHDPGSLGEALTCTTAYYQVHSLGSKNFAWLDADAAQRFGRAASEARVEHIVYLGVLGRDDEDLSAHLRSRREVERLLSVGDVPVTVLRAGIVIGAGGLSPRSGCPPSSLSKGEVVQACPAEADRGCVQEPQLRVRAPGQLG